MAKDKTTTKAPEKNEEKAKKQAPPQPPKPKYGVTELAQALGVKETSVRVRLRNAGVEKNGKVYGWDTKSEMQAVVDRLKSKAKAKAAAAETEEEEEEEE